MSDLPAWVTAVISIFGGGTVGAIVGAAAKSRKAREESATAVVPQLREMVDEMLDEVREARDEVKAVQAARAQDRSDYEAAISGLQADMQSAIRASDDRCERLRKEDREACAKETAEAVERATAPLRKELVKLAHEARRTRRDLVGREDTGVQMLDQIVKRVSKSDPELRPAPFEPETRPDTPKAIARLPLARREIPPPKRRGVR